MNKLAVTLGLIFLGLITLVVLSLDNSPRPTPEQDDAAYEEWHEMDQVFRDLVCDKYANSRNNVRLAMSLDGLNEGEIRARLDLMERECD